MRVRLINRLYFARFSRKRSATGAMSFLGLALIAIVSTIAAMMTMFTVTVAMAGYQTQKLAFVSSQVANYAYSLGPNTPNRDAKAKAFANSLFTNMGVKFTNVKMGLTNTVTADGQKAVLVQTTYSFSIAGINFPINLTYTAISSPALNTSSRTAWTTPPVFPSGFELLTSYRTLGGLLASAIGPGPNSISQNVYLSYTYYNTFDLVSVDLNSGNTRIFPSPVQGENGAWGITVGADGNLYLGTLPTAHLVRLDTKSGSYVDLGRPCSTETWIWSLTKASDGKIYGVTSPNCRLFRYDPKTKAMEDLGRMDPAQQYGRWVAADKNGFVYVGIGTTQANIVAYEIATGKYRSILPSQFQTPTIAEVYQGLDGNVYGIVGTQYFKLSNWTATPIGSAQVAAHVSLNGYSIAQASLNLPNGSCVTVSGNNISTMNLTTGAVTNMNFSYQGNLARLFRLGLGTQGNLYASSDMPGNILRLEPDNSAFKELGSLGDGEAYSLLPYGDSLLVASYSSFAPLMRLNPMQPIQPKSGNPTLIGIGNIDGDWRPQAMIYGPEGKVYVGGISTYGQLGGPLVVWDPKSGSINNYSQIVKDQSVISLASWNNQIVGGTTIQGGGGSTPTQTDAKLFLFDTKTQKKVFEMVPVKGATNITDLVTGYNDLIYGIAYNNTEQTLFVFNSRTRQVRERKVLSSIDVSNLYNCAALGPDGRIWGLTSNGIFVIDTYSDSVKIVANAPEIVNGGFAIKNGCIYLISGPNLYRYRIPRLN